MKDLLVHAVVWLNAIANLLGHLLLAPIAALPGWLSATIVSAVTGVVLLVAYKYTSKQRAIKRVKDSIKANLLAMKLFKDNVSVTLKSQGHVFYGALCLFLLSIVPMLVMIVPVTLILGQLALWYQVRPLHLGEETVVTLKLGGDIDAPWPKVQLKPNPALEVTTGPIRIKSQRALCWNVKALKKGYQQLQFQVDDQTADKDLAIGDGFMRVSTLRPNWSWSDVLLNPAEKPFPSDSPVQSIEIEYPSRVSWTSGTDWWVIYWFAVSMVSAFCFRPLLNVNL